MDQVRKVKNLGEYLSEDGFMNKEIKKVTSAEDMMFSAVRKGFLSNKEVSKNTKLSVDISPSSHTLKGVMKTD